MAIKEKQDKRITQYVIKEIDKQIKHGLNIKEFNNNFHQIVKKSIEEQLE